MKNLDLPIFGPFKVILFDNGFYGVQDTRVLNGLMTIASGMTRKQAVDFAVFKRNGLN